ncbi:PREDICTED: probable 28S rRNA (cytosine-C(5))-methyltransferase [Polistes dominula]|uniref:Probable 28S rRNA (Cytosine-C(5))-methyltransferase n=1 Tax=Polistes dominula TaxID=743375 RepID=A0ABM1JDE3_POLDO|nr:PREDICTED: probable 28S rRNA (cytosine-C(5))-methyltransferase [Polistes dominula]
MSEGFVHSIKVPRIYKLASKIVRDVQENGASFKSLIFSEKHPNVSGLYALTSNTLQKSDQLNQLIIATKILINEPRFDPWLARVLITELIWGKKRLTSNAKPIETLLNYESRLRDALKNINDSDVAIPQKTVSKPRYVRVNTLLLSVQEAIENFEYEGWSLLLDYTDYSSYLKLISNLSEPYFTKDYHVPELLVFPYGTSFFNHPSYTNGKVLLQDKASCLPSFILNPPIGSVVLDMCASPGMKTSHLAAILQNQGTIYAVEIENRRYQTLSELLKTTNSNCVRTINKDALCLDPSQCPDVEYILVDPSCSGSGIIDRPKMGKKDVKDERRLKSLQSFQVFLLRHALLNFPTVKKVVYSTCSLNREENEDVIDEILTNIGDAYKLVSIKKYLKKDWLNYSSKDSNCKNKCIYAKPEVDLCNGFFVALFKRNFDVPLPLYTPRMHDTSIGTENTNFNENKEINNQENNENQNNNSSSNCKKKKKRKKRKRADDTEKKREEGNVNPEEINDKEEDYVIISEESSKRKHESASKSTTKKLKT